MAHGFGLNYDHTTVEGRPMALSPNEFSVLGVVAEKGPIDAADCARLTELGPGITDATLRSLVNRGLALANKARHGLTKRPDGTYSITKAGRAALAA